MVSEPRALVDEARYERASFKHFTERIKEKAGRTKRLLLDYPCVYVISSPGRESYDVYVGETNSIRERANEHFIKADANKPFWSASYHNENSRLYVIGHDYFNKSLTLDLEDHLMLYLTSSPKVRKVHNKRANPQNDYYTRDHFERIFRQIWRALRKRDPELFPTEAIIRQSALFKASPFHKPNPEQLKAKSEITAAIQQALKQRKISQLILVEGEAGSGKTVLLSKIFFDLVRGEDDADTFDFQNWNAHLLVNHEEQLTVYREIARKLGVLKKHGEERVSRPTRFINRHQPERPVDVVLVDEAHLLWTQGHQGYQGSNQLEDLLERAKVVVAVFDAKQIMATTAYWEPQALDAVRAKATKRIKLENQMRIDSSPATVEWIRDLIDGGVIRNIPSDPKYDLRIFDSPDELYAEIQERASEVEHGLSRLLATYDWRWRQKRPEDKPHWCVDFNYINADGKSQHFSIPWNRELEYEGLTRHRKTLSWAEQKQTIRECGSHFTVQGLDLNYAGVILGPSVGYQDGRIILRKDKSANRSATQNRTRLDGTKVCVAEELLRNELNVLLTRGVHGLYIYAVDDELRSILMAAQEGKR